jgi:hypothetical protein
MVNYKENDRSTEHRGNPGGAATPVSWVAAFLTFFTPPPSADPNYGNVANLLNSFSANTPNNLSFASPIAGITDHAVPGQKIGAGFVGRPQIHTLFQQLFASFNPLTFNAIDTSPNMQSADGLTIAVRLTVKGTQTGPWHAPGNPGGAGHSPSLSETRPRQKARQSRQSLCAPFSPLTAIT